MKQSIKYFKSGFHRETNMGPSVFSLCYFLEMLFFIYHLLSSMPFAADNFAAKSTWCKSAPAITVSEEAAEAIGTLRYGNADALKYTTVEESLGQEHSVRGGKIKLRFVASD